MHLRKRVYTGRMPSSADQQADIIEMHFCAAHRSLAQPLQQERRGRCVHPNERGTVHVDTPRRRFGQSQTCLPKHMAVQIPV